jgi:hypothetical protein
LLLLYQSAASGWLTPYLADALTLAAGQFTVLSSGSQQNRS